MTVSSSELQNEQSDALCLRNNRVKFYIENIAT